MLIVIIKIQGKEYGFIEEFRKIIGGHNGFFN